MKTKEDKVFVSEAYIEGVCKRVIKDERSKGRTIYIALRGLDEEGYNRIRRRLKKKVFKLVSRVTCTIGVTDSHSVDIRERDKW